MARLGSSARSMVGWTLSISILMVGCTSSLDVSLKQRISSDEGQVEDVERYLNTAQPGSQESTNPIKGHIQITQAAFKALSLRNLLPPQMSDWDSQYFVYYGNDFADHPWIGRPHFTPGYDWAPHLIAVKQLRTMHRDDDWGFSGGFGSTGWSVRNSGTYWTNVNMRLNATGTVGWVTHDSLEEPNTYMRFMLKLDVVGASIAGFSTSSQPLTYSLDNFYHYAFRDVNEMPGLTQAERDDNSTLKLFPISNFDLPDDVTETVAGRMVNQPLLAGADRGITKYGAILYQLARKFFASSCQEPSLAELIPAGADHPGFNVGTTQGSGNLSSFELKYPHTMLGGMPYVCRFDEYNSSDPCQFGAPTWPVWVPETGIAPTRPADGDPNNPEVLSFVSRLSEAKPGRSDHAALIYLGWATHMIQDAATPHHAANWTGFEHNRQDGYGDESRWWTRSASVNIGGNFNIAVSPIEAAAWGEIDNLLGTVANPKSRAQIEEICKSQNISKTQLLNGELNYRSVQPLFLSTASAAFASKMVSTTEQKYVVLPGQIYGGHWETVYKASTADPYVKKYLGNALLATIKLLLCAPPITTNTTCPAQIDEPLNQGNVASQEQRYPWDFNVFTIGNAFGLHDVGGPIAAGGALSLDSFSVNSRGLKPVALVVGGRLDLSNGQVYGIPYAGGEVNIQWTAHLNSPAFNPGAKQIKAENPIDFGDVQVRLRALSDELRNYPDTGTTTPTASGVLFTGNLPRYNVFSVSGAALANYRTFEMVIPAGATAVINVLNDLPNDQTPATIQNAGIYLNSTDPRRVLWNFSGVQKNITASITIPV